MQILSGAVGLGAYIALAGGMAEWARMAGAGLPASQGLSFLAPATLVASGFQTLLLVPLALAALIAADWFQEAIRDSKLPAVRLARRGRRFLTQGVILFFIIAGALVPTMFVLAGLVLAGGSTTWVLVVAAVTGLAVPSVLGVTACVLKQARPENAAGCL